MKRVFVSGKYNDNDVLKVLKNMRLGMQVCTRLFFEGYAPFCPWLDYHYALNWPEDVKEITVKDYHQMTMEWLRVSEVVLMLPNWKKSKGAKCEREEAIKLGIPIYYDIEKLLREIET